MLVAVIVGLGVDVGAGVLVSSASSIAAIVERRAISVGVKVGSPVGSTVGTGVLVGLIWLCVVATEGLLTSDFSIVSVLQATTTIKNMTASHFVPSTINHLLHAYHGIYVLIIP